MGEKDIQQISSIITSILKAHGAEYVAIFGSAARGEAKKDSDIDILVRFSQDISLLDHIGFAQELEDILGRKVDLITERSLSKYVIPNVRKDLKVLYGQGQRPGLR
jgi:hypothetical protein